MKMPKRAAKQKLFEPTTKLVSDQVSKAAFTGWPESEFWIGISDPDHDKIYSFESTLISTSDVFQNWCEYEPTGKVEHCVIINAQNSAMGSCSRTGSYPDRWNDIMCHQERHFICQEVI